MLVAPSLSETNIWYIFKPNGQETKVSFDGKKIVVLHGYLSPSKQQIALKKIKESI